MSDQAAPRRNPPRAAKFRAYENIRRFVAADLATDDTPDEPSDVMQAVAHELDEHGDVVQTLPARVNYDDPSSWARDALQWAQYLHSATEYNAENIS